MNLAELSRLGTNLVGRTIVYLQQTGSTNVVAMDMAQRGAPEGTVVFSDYQTAGHGRRGRPWLADAGACLLCSVILRPRIVPTEAFYLTMVPALSTLAAVEALGLEEVGLKWPNDVEIRKRKVAGILTELSLRGEDLDFAVAGIGLNVNLNVSAHPEIALQATSLSAELGATIRRVDVAQALLRELEQRYLVLGRGGGMDIFSEWRDRLTTLGQVVDVTEPQGSFRALAEDVTSDGGLVLRRNHERMVVYGGDVTLAQH